MTAPRPDNSPDGPVEQEDESAEEAVRGEGWTPGDVLVSAAAFLAFLGAWEGLVRLLQVPAVILPPPSSVVAALAAIIASGTMLTHLLVTLTEIVLGFALGAASAFVLGALIAQFRLVDRIVYPYIVAFQAVPKVAIAPLLVIWFGFGIESKVLMTAIIAFFPILVNTTVGLRSVEAERLDLMLALKATRWQTFRHVRLPTALPFIFAGLEVGVVLSVIGAIVGEFVGANAGLGYLLLVYNADLRIAAVFALLIVLAALGIVLHALVQLVRRRVMFWMPSRSDQAGGA